MQAAFHSLRRRPRSRAELPFVDSRQTRDGGGPRVSARSEGISFPHAYYSFRSSMITSTAVDDERFLIRNLIEHMNQYQTTTTNRLEVASYFKYKACFFSAVGKCLFEKLDQLKQRHMASDHTSIYR